ncbi:MAG TPA: TolC family protein [Thiobacillus sp.]|nr:TolC family protein [Thiobacillus sp.]
MNIRLSLLLVMLFSSAASAADPFRVLTRTLPSPAAELRPEAACEATAVAGVLTLARAVERALCANPATRSAWLTARLRAAELGQAQSAYLPEISLSARLGRNGDDLLTTDRTAWQLGLDAQYLLYDFGGRTARRDAAEALLAAARASHDASVRVLYLQTVTAYFSLLTAQGAVVAARETEASALEAFKAASARVEAGTGIPVDRLQAKTVYIQREIERIRAEGEAARLRGELAALMGDVSQTSWMLAEDEAAFSQTLDPSRAVDALIDAARNRRAEFRAAEATVLAREAGVRSADAAGKPRLSAFFGSGRQDSGSQAANSSSLGVNLTIPLFTGYRSTYEIAAAQTQADLARVERDRVANQVALEVWRAYYRLQSETEADRRSADLVESAAAAERLALGRYQAGLGILLDVLTAQANLAQARQGQLQTRLGLRVARAELAQAIGELSWDWMEPAWQEGIR